MRAMRAEQFSGYEALKLVELPKPTASEERVLVRITAAGVTPLDYTILSGKFHTTKVPLVLGNEGAGVVEADGGTDFPAGSRVMFWGPMELLRTEHIVSGLLYGRKIFASFLTMSTT
jgi:NADPH2:quinone reductase